MTTPITPEQALEKCRIALAYYATSPPAGDSIPSYARETIAATAPDKVAPAVPDGWQLVPKRATIKMKNAAKALEGCSDRVKYEAMLAAAPGAGK